MLNEQELLNLKEEVEQSKTTINELNGELKGVMTQLKNDWGQDTIEEAELQITTIDNKILSLDKEIESATLKLE
jgi:predicted  nucleic acid-binding Zn-ribbon protein